MRTPTPDQAEAERRKAEALALMEARREIFVRRGRRALLDALLRSGTATADDVRAAVELPAGMDPRCLGSVPGRLAYDKIIAPAGFVRSTRPEGHARWIGRWELIDRAAAERWLRDHPDLPDPGEPDEARETRQAELFDPQETATPTGATAGAA
jgi:hypothetical protein